MDSLIKQFYIDGFQVFYKKLNHELDFEFKSDSDFNIFINSLVKDKKQNPNSEIQEFIDFLLESKNPFSNISEIDYRNIVLYNKIRSLYYENTKDDTEYLTILSEFYKDNYYYLVSLLLIGTHYAKFSHLGKAFKFYNKAQEIIPRVENIKGLNKIKVMIYANLAYVYFDAGQFANAENHFKKATKYIIKSNTYIYLVFKINMLKARIRLGKISPKKYLKSLDEIEEKYPEDISKLAMSMAVNRSTCHIENKDYKKALEILELYLKNNKLEEELVVINYLICMYQLENYNEFEALYKREIDKLLEFSKLSPEHNIFEYALDIARKKKDKIWENQCLKTQIKFESKFYSNNKLFMLQMAQNQHQLKLKEQDIKNEKIKAQNLIDFKNTLLRKNEELEQFASIVAHDIKSPLRNVVNFLGILEYSLNLNDDEKEIFRSIKESNIKLDKFVDDLVSYAKYGKAIEDFYFVDLNETIIGVKKLLKETIVENQVSININSKLPKLYAYDSACTQLFLNLINNSIKFKKTTESLKVDIWHESKKSKTYFYIKDNGIGIKDEEIGSIFRAFKRGSTNKKTEGIGIGLATCQKIIDNINAKISVESAINKGTTFKIEIEEKLTKS